jgi:anaerobic selenocysteine-containing dehydrogenase
MRTLMDARRHGGKAIVINPAKERGLENFSVPSDIRSLLFGSEIASSYLQSHISGDIALFKGFAKSLLELEKSDTEVRDKNFITNHTKNFSKIETGRSEQP